MEKDPRDQWQDEAINIWYRDGCRGTIEAATGTGKSFVGKKVIDRENEARPNETIDVVVPSRFLKKQWEEDYIKKFNLKNVEVTVVNTYVKNMSSRNPYMIILDEIHNYPAPTFSKVMLTKAKFILGLTATIERKDGKHLSLLRVAPIVYRLSMPKARQMGIVAQYEIYNLGIDITQQDRIYYEKIHGMFNELFKKFDYDFQLALRCSFKNADSSRAVIARRHNVTLDEVKKWAFTWSWAMRERKNFFYHAPSKVKAVSDIYKYFDSPTIVFSEGTKFADKVTDAIGEDCRSYHTNLITEIRQVWKDGKPKKMKMGTKKLCYEALDLFNEKKIKCLSTARALNEGFSANGVEVAIMASYTSDIRTFIQRMGRAVRFVEGKEAKIIALYLKSFQNKNGDLIRSQEEKWLKQAQKSQVGVHWINDLSEIDKQPLLL